MLKKLRILLLALLAALCCTVTAWADYDYIDRYDVTAAPNVDDGSLTITVDLTWTALEELPYGQELKIGVPNGSVRDEEALTDNIERLSFDNSYMYVYLDRAYRQGETFTFSYRWVQEYMYTLSGNTVTFDYTPGWFDEARVGEMTLKWIDPAGLIGDLTAAADAGGTAAPQTGMMTITASDLGYGETMGVHAVYTDWPTVLSSDNSAVNAPNDGWYDGDEDEDTSMAGMFLTLIITIFIVWVVVRILRELFSGYAGGFGKGHKGVCLLRKILIQLTDLLFRVFLDGVVEGDLLAGECELHNSCSFRQCGKHRSGSGSRFPLSLSVL